MLVVDEQCVNRLETIPRCLDESYGEAQEPGALSDDEDGREEALEALAGTLRQARELHGDSS